MSMITEQVEYLIKLSNKQPFDSSIPTLQRACKEAANTISVLSEKLQAANMERSTAYYNGGWTPVKERLPEEYGEYLITWTTSQTKRSLIAICEYEITSEYDHKYSRFKGEWLLDDYIKNYSNVNVIAWMPLPLPFKEDKTE